MNLTLLLALSATMWYLINRGKEEIWGALSFSKWITIGVSAIFAFALTFFFGLDVLTCCGLYKEVTIAGEIITAFTLMSGSSAISEVIERIQGQKE